VRNNFILMFCFSCKQRHCGCLGHYRRVRRWWRACRNWWRCRMLLHRCETCHVKWWRWKIYDFSKILWNSDGV